MRVRSFCGFLGFASLFQLIVAGWLGAGCTGPAFTSGSAGGAFQGSGGTASGGTASDGGASGGALPSEANGGALASALGGGGATAFAGATAGGSSGGAPGPVISADALLLWLSADRGVTTTSGAVSKWQDQSNNRADATQVVATARPRLVSGSASRSMIEFDGEDDALALPEGFADFSNGLSFFAVLEALGDDECASIVQLSNGPEIEDIDFGRQQRSVHYEAGAAYVTGSADALPKGERKMVSVVQAASSEVELRVDGQYLNSASVPLPNTLPRVANFIARTLYVNCAPLKARIGEIILYSRALDSAERAHVENYLRNRWDCCRN